MPPALEKHFRDGSATNRGAGQVWVQLEVGLSSLPPLSVRIRPKSKNATDSTDSTDSKSLADDTFELEQPAPVQDLGFFDKSVKSVKSVAFLF
jgi:hypothetical protein